MFVMTNLVGVLCGDKIWKRVFSSTLLLILLGFLFLGNVQNAFATHTEGHGTGVGSSPKPVPVNVTVPDTVSGDTDIRQTPADAVAQQNALVAENMGSTPDGVLGLFHSYVLTGIGWLVGQAGKAFDYAISEFIVGFGNLYVNGNVGDTIDNLWSTVRDIFNLTFIFGLVYIGFKMILDSSDSSARKMLVSLIGAALLVNFSLFITKFVIDFSNIAATQIFNAFEGPAGQTLSITNGFMTVMGITSMMSYEYTAGGTFAYVFGMLLVFSILAYVFLAGAIMIIIRFVVLNIYMVFSPFMFLGWVFPALQGYSKDYWSGFLRQAFFAPAFLFMLYLSYKVAASFPVQRDLANMFSPNGSTVSDAPGLIPYFAMVIVFLCASMVVAKKMGAHGASVAVSTGKHMAGRAAGGLTVGLAARAGRTVVGGSANALTQSKTFRKLAANTGFVGKGMMLGAGKVADSSFDLRNAGGLGKSLGMGAGKKGGFTTRIKESKESDNKYNELLGKVAPEDNPEVKRQQAALDKLKNDLNNTRDDEVKDQINGQIKIVEAQLKTALKAAKEPEQVYANQLTYMRRKEAWLKKQKALLNGATAIGAGVGLGLLTGGVVPGVIAAAGAYGASKGINGHTKADIKAIEKEYGDKGQNKDKNEAEKAAAKAIAKALKDAGEAPKPKEDDH